MCWLCFFLLFFQKFNLMSVNSTFIQLIISTHVFKWRLVDFLSDCKQVKTYWKKCKNLLKSDEWDCACCRKVLLSLFIFHHVICRINTSSFLLSLYFASLLFLIGNIFRAVLVTKMLSLQTALNRVLLQQQTKATFDVRKRINCVWKSDLPLKIGWIFVWKSETTLGVITTLMWVFSAPLKTSYVFLKGKIIFRWLGNLLASIVWFFWCFHD